MIRIRAFVAGTVQGVGYRQTCRRKGRELGLVGWVRNLADGRVEVIAQGPDDKVDLLLDWLWLGPPHARVNDVESTMLGLDANLQDFLVAQ